VLLQVKLHFSAEAQEAMAGMSAEGRAFLIRSLELHVTPQPADNHVHAGGMCCLLERREAGSVWVKQLSPVCLEPK
jgi:hypothetical protein